MEASTTIKTFIKLQEGLRLKAYKCKAGVYTIGYGHTQGVKKGDYITQQEAEEFFENDCIQTEINLDRKIKKLGIHEENKIIVQGKTHIIKQHHFDALFSLSFNCGLRATTVILYRFKQKGDKNTYTKIEEVAKYNQSIIMPETKIFNIISMPTILFLFRMWINVDGVPVKGLFNRRTAEAGIFQKREYMLID